MQYDKLLLREQQSSEEDPKSKQRIIKFLLFLIAIPIVALASMITPTPIIYQQEKSSYNEEVSIEIAEIVTTVSVDILETPPERQTGGVSAIEEEPVGPPECYCTTYLRVRLGVNIRGDAVDILPNITEPFVGAVVLLNLRDKNGKRIGHNGLIIYNLADRIIIKDSNFIKCTPTRRMIMKDDPRIRGYYFKNPN